MFFLAVLFVFIVIPLPQQSLRKRICLSITSLGKMDFMRFHEVKADFEAPFKLQILNLKKRKFHIHHPIPESGNLNDMTVPCFCNKTEFNLSFCMFCFSSHLKSEVFILYSKAIPWKYIHPKNSSLLLN